MCGIAGALAREPDGRAARGRGRAGRGRDGAPRSRRLRLLPRRAGGAGAPAAVDHRSVGGGAAADDQRGRPDRHRRQRRDLQPRRAARRPGSQGPPLPQRQRLRGRRAPLRRGRGAHARAAARDVRVRGLGRAHARRCCWRAIGSARSRCTTATAPTASCSPPRSRRWSPTRARRPTMSLEALDSYLALQYVPAPRHDLRSG